MHASLLLRLLLLVTTFLSHPSISPHSPHPNSPLRPVLMFSRAATSVAPRLAARATLRPASSIRAFSSEKAEDVVVEEEVSSAELSGRLGNWTNPVCIHQYVHENLTFASLSCPFRPGS